jgi:hypothetical protein
MKYPYRNKYIEWNSKNEVPLFQTFLLGGGGGVFRLRDL